MRSQPSPALVDELTVAALAAAVAALTDPEYADVDEDDQLSLGVAGEQRSIPGLAPRRDGGDHA